MSNDLISRVTQLPGIRCPQRLELIKSFGGPHRVFFVRGYWWDSLKRPIFTNPTGQPTKYHGRWTFIKMHVQEETAPEDFIIEVPWANRMAGKFFSRGNPDKKPISSVQEGQRPVLEAPMPSATGAG